MKLKIQLLITLIAVLFISGCFLTEPYPNERNISTSTNETKNLDNNTLDNNTNDAMSNIENDKIYFQVTNETEYLEEVDCSFDSIFYCNDNIKASNERVVYDFIIAINSTLNNIEIDDFLVDNEPLNDCNIEMTNINSYEKYEKGMPLFIEARDTLKIELLCNNVDFSNVKYFASIKMQLALDNLSLEQQINITNYAEKKNSKYEILIEDFPKYVGNYERNDNYDIEPMLGDEGDSIGLLLTYETKDDLDEYNDQEIAFIHINNKETERELKLLIQEELYLVEIEGNKLITTGEDSVFWLPNNTFFMVGFEIEYDIYKEFETVEDFKQYVLNNDFYKTFIKEFPSNNSRVEELSLIRNFEEAFE